MPFFDKAKQAMGKAADIGSDVAAKSKRQAQRGKLEIEAKRISGKIDDEKAQIGQLLVPLLQSGQLSVDNADVAAHLASIAALESELAEKRREIDAILHAEKSEAERAANAG